MAGFAIARLAVLAVVTILISVSLAGAAPHITVEVATGKVLDRSQEFDRWYPASLTKLMTGYVVFREIKVGHISLGSPVKVSSHALAQPPSKMGLPVGTVMDIDNALKIVMVKSANDIAVAIAEAVAGNEAAFVRMMNEHAARIGMKDTHFTNPHGLHDTGQYTTARDMAVLAMAIKREFRQYRSYFSLPAIRHGKRTMQNHNPLIQRFPGANGMKTGYLCASGLNIVGSAHRGGRELIVVVLGGPTGQERNVRAARLLTEGFRKPSLFVTDKLGTLSPRTAVRTTPVDMRDTVCKRKPRKSVQKAESTTVFALEKPTLDDLEEKYLKPVGHNTKVVTITLGNATGPDPHGLLGPVSQGTALAFAASGGDSVEWPIVPGTKNTRVPVPTARPGR